MEIGLSFKNIHLSLKILVMLCTFSLAELDYTEVNEYSILYFKACLYAL